MHAQKRSSVALWLAGALLAAPLLADVKVMPDIKVLQHFTLIDGNGGAPVSDASMIVNKGRIQWVGPSSQLKAPKGAQNIDLSGKYVMPGIINLHGHVGNVVDLTQDAKNFTPENIEKNLKTYAMYGVTTVLSMGTEQEAIFPIRAAQRASGRPNVARVYTAGRGFTMQGGYGGMPGVTFALKDNSEIDKDISQLAKDKVDIVKIWVDDHLGHMKKMPPDMSKAIIDSARKHGLRVAAHIFYLQDAKQLTNDGVAGLAHSVRDKPVDQELIDSMKQHGTWQLAATLTREASTFVYAKTPQFANDPFFTKGVSAKVVQTLKDPSYQQKVASDPDFPRYQPILKQAQRNLKALVDAGVKYGFGTDSGPPGRFPGYFEQWEMELEVEAGLTPQQVITGATKNAAEFLNAKDLGTLEARKWADLIVLDKNPLDNIKNTRTIQAVYIGGNKIE